MSKQAKTAFLHVFLHVTVGPTVWKVADSRRSNLRSPLCQACPTHARGGAAYHRHGHRHRGVVGDGRRIACMYPVHLKVCVRRTLIWQGEGGDRRNVALFHAIEKCYFMRFVFTYIHHLCDWNTLRCKPVFTICLHTFFSIAGAIFKRRICDWKNLNNHWGWCECR